MGRHAKTEKLIEAARAVLADDNPMTLRQVYYRLVASQVIENTPGRYQALSHALVAARQEGLIPWEWIEDRIRRPRHVAMWSGLADFRGAVIRSYRRDVWASQSCYFETWLEKDALSGKFGDVLGPYGVTLNVGRGYDGWSSIREAAERYGDGDGVTVLYFGDFDPSGEDMVRSLGERLGFFGCYPEIVKCALTLQDVIDYRLPAAMPKKTDTRAAAFVDRYGETSVELDALPARVLTERLEYEIRRRLDLVELERVQETERQERAHLREMLAA